MASTTFSGPVRSEEGFLQKDESGNWVPVSGGGGEALDFYLRFRTSIFDTNPPLPIIGTTTQRYIYDGTQSSDVTIKPQLLSAPGTYTNPTVSATNSLGIGFVTQVSNGSPPAGGSVPTVSYVTATGPWDPLYGFEMGIVPANSWILDITITMTSVAPNYYQFYGDIGDEFGSSVLFSTSGDLYSSLGYSVVYGTNYWLNGNVNTLTWPGGMVWGNFFLTPASGDATGAQYATTISYVTKPV